MTHTNDNLIFQIDSGLKEWQIPARDWLDLYRQEKDETKQRIDGLCTGSAVFNEVGRILLVQRADHDSSPGFWEVPGGAVDEDDVTILHGAARELREETGLIARKINHVVISDHEKKPYGLTIFPNRHRTKWFGRVIFEVEVQSYSEVKLDPNEHQNFVWASENEIKDGKIIESTVQKIYPSMQKDVLSAFQLHSESKGNLS